ncbi:MAG: peptidylprolyl isomerase [Kofleriaceae bacterium]
MSRWLLAIARARAFQFMTIGAVLFAIAPPTRDESRIEISSRELANATSSEAARRGITALDADESAAVRARVIEDKLLFREGVRLGLDQGDPMIQQRVVQKVLLLAEDLGGASREPSVAEKLTEYTRAIDRYREPARYHLMQVFANQREDLPVGRLDPVALPDAGEPLPTPRETQSTRAELEHGYGPGFADAVVARAPSADYSDPIQSILGWHRIRVVEIVPGRAPAFAEVERRLAFDLIVRRRAETVRAYLAEVASRYEVVVDGAPIPITPTGRLARQESASGED